MAVIIHVEPKDLHQFKPAGKDEPQCGAVLRRKVDPNTAYSCTRPVHRDGTPHVAHSQPDEEIIRWAAWDRNELIKGLRSALVGLAMETRPGVFCFCHDNVKRLWPDHDEHTAVCQAAVAALTTAEEEGYHGDR